MKTYKIPVKRVKRRRKSIGKILKPAMKSFAKVMVDNIYKETPIFDWLMAQKL